MAQYPILFFSVGNGAMNAPLYWQLQMMPAYCTDQCDETSADTPRLSLLFDEFSWARWELGS
jgi:hypothetical protein